jgi:hypothetical protein
MYKKRGRHDKDAELANNDEGQFASKFFYFIRKHPYIIISHVCVPQVNLDIGIGFTLSSADSAPVIKSTLCMTSKNPPLAHYYMSKARR